MTTPAIIVQPANSIYYPAELITKNKISRLVVTESSMVGFVTMTDYLVPVSPLLVTKIYAKDREFLKGTNFSVPTVMFFHLTFADIMMTNVISIRSEFDVAEGSSLMLKHGISGLPVLGNVLELVGVFAKTDVCRILAKMNRN